MKTCTPFISFLFGSCFLHAQTLAPQPVFTGTAKLSAQSTSGYDTARIGVDDYLRLQAAPTFAAWDVPFTANIFLSMENDPARAAMNSITFSFDTRAFAKSLRQRAVAAASALKPPDLASTVEDLKRKAADPASMIDTSRLAELRAQAAGAAAMADSARAELNALQGKAKDAERLRGELERYQKMKPEEFVRAKEREARAMERELRDPAKLRAKLEELNLLGGAEKFFMNLKQFGAGVTYPRYSPLVLEGMPLNGLALEYDLGPVHLAGAGGRAGSPIPDGLTKQQTYRRTLYAGRIGLGAFDGTHLHIAGLYAADDPASLPEHADTATGYAPARDYVADLDGALILFDGDFELRAEGAGTVLTRDVAAPAVTDIGKHIPPAVVKAIDPNISSGFDWAANASLALRLFAGATRIRAEGRRIGPGYASFGAPYLRADVLGGSGELEQSLFDGQAVLGGFYRRDQDNLAPLKRVEVDSAWRGANTVETSFGANLTLAFAGLPWLRAEYAPYRQATTIDSFGVGPTYNTDMIAITAGHAFELLGASHSTALSIISQTGASADGRYDFRSRMASVNHAVAFPSRMSITVDGTYTDQYDARGYDRVVALGVGATFALLDKALKCTAGLTYNASDREGLRLGGRLRVGVPLWAFGDLDLVAEHAGISGAEAPYPNGSQTVVRTTVGVRW